MGAGAAAAKLTAAGGWGAAAVPLAKIAAPIAGFYAGMKINDSTLEAGLQDATSHLSDNSLSAGAGVDIRGNTLYQGTNRKAATTNLNLDYIRRGSSAFGMSFAPMAAAMGGKPGDDFHAYNLMDSTYKTANRIGVGGDALAGFMGQSAMSGAVNGSDQGAMNKLLKRIAESTEEASKHGVSGNQHLATLASLQQVAQSKSGYLTEHGSGIMLNLATMLNASNNPATKGQNAMGAVNALLGNDNEQALVYGMSRMLDGGMGKFNKGGRAIAERQLGAKTLENMEKGGYTPADIAKEAAETPAAKLEHAQMLLKQGGRGMPAKLQDFILGLAGVGGGQAANLKQMLINGPPVGSDPEFMKKALGMTGGGNPERDKDTGGAEALLAKSLLALNVDKTARSFVTLNEVIGMNIALERAKMGASKSGWGLLDSATSIPAKAAAGDLAGAGKAAVDVWKATSPLMLQMNLLTAAIEKLGYGPSGKAQ
jgi:hypothetical protein